MKPTFVRPPSKRDLCDSRVLEDLITKFDKKSILISQAWNSTIGSIVALLKTIATTTSKTYIRLITQKIVKQGIQNQATAFAGLQLLVVESKLDFYPEIQEIPHLRNFN